jgi:hypothetical protein
VKVEMIEREEDVERMKVLFESEVVGMDTEWRPSLHKLDISKPNVFQISSDSHAFVIDLDSLSGSPSLNYILSTVFLN